VDRVRSRAPSGRPVVTESHDRGVSMIRPPDIPILNPDQISRPAPDTNSPPSGPSRSER